MGRPTDFEGADFFFGLGDSEDEAVRFDPVCTTTVAVNSSFAEATGSDILSYELGREKSMVVMTFETSNVDDNIACSSRLYRGTIC